MKTLKRDESHHDSFSGGLQSSLVSKNISIFNRRTSIRLEPEMWNALGDIAKREVCSVHDICSLVYVRKGRTTSLTAAIRVFLMLYYRAATTEEGHANAGHGNFEIMKRRAKISPEYDAMFEGSLKRAHRAVSLNAGHNDN